MMVRIIRAAPLSLFLRSVLSARPMADHIHKPAKGVAGVYQPCQACRRAGSEPVSQPRLVGTYAWRHVSAAGSGRFSNLPDLISMGLPRTVAACRPALPRYSGVTV